MNAMIPGKILAYLLAAAATIFGLIAIGLAIHSVIAYFYWPRVNAVVRAIYVYPIGDYKYGSANVNLSYKSNTSEYVVAANKTFLPGQGEKFVRDYAVGTWHTIWVDPSHSGAAELELGWNPGTLFVPLFVSAMCLGLSTAARYYWRFGRVSSDVPHT